MDYRGVSAMHNKSKYIPYLVIILSAIISPTTVYAERLSAKHLYNFAKNQNEQMLSRYRRWINMADNGGNTALCIALQKDDGKSYYLLKKYGASTNVRCMRQFSERQTADIATDSSNDGKFLGMGKIGWGVLGVSAIGGGIAAASSGGGGGSSAGVSRKKEDTLYGSKGNLTELNDAFNNSVSLNNDKYRDVTGLASYSYVSLSESIFNNAKGSVSIKNREDGNVEGSGPGNARIDIDKLDTSITSTPNSSISSVGTVYIDNEGNGEVIGIKGGLDNASSRVINFNNKNFKSTFNAIAEGTIEIDNKGNGDVYGIKDFTTYGSSEVKNAYASAGTSYNKKVAAGAMGVIKIINEGDGDVYGIYGDKVHNADILASSVSVSENSRAVASGLIAIGNTGKGNSYGMYGSSVYNKTAMETNGNVQSNILMLNEGTGNSIGMYGKNTVDNSGNIDMKNYTNGVAIGIYADGAKAVNSGNITIEQTSQGTAIGIYGTKRSSIINTGTITISGGGTAYGIYSEGSSVKNSGTIKINGNSNSPNAIKLNGGKLFQNGILEGGNLALNEYGGEVVASTDSKFVAKNSISGDLSVSDSVVADGFANSYTIKEAIDAADATDLKLNSKSALFEAKLAENNNDIVMEMKDFNEVVADKSVAGFLSDNYNQQNNEKLFSSLKGMENSHALNQALEDMTGKEMFNRFAFEDLTMMREFNFDLNNKLFNNQEETLSTSGNISSWMFSGADNSQTKYSLNNITVGKNTVGLAIALTDINSKGNDGNNSRNDRMYQVAMPIGYQAYGFNFITTPSIGYSYGTYNRHGFNNSYYKGTVEKQMFGVMNEARYPFIAAGWNLDIALEFNVLGYHISGDEGSREYGLNIAEQNTYSAEAGIGLYANKEISLAKDSKLKLYNGIAVYHEFADPYKMKIGMNGMAGTFTLQDENHSANRAIIRTGFDYTKQDLSLYGSLSSYIDRELQTNADLGLKYSF